MQQIFTRNIMDTWFNRSRAHGPNSPAYENANYHHYWATYWWNVHSSQNRVTNMAPYMGCECDDRLHANYNMDTCECFHSNSSDEIDHQCHGYQYSNQWTNSDFSTLNDQGQDTHYIAPVSSGQICEENLYMDHDETEEVELEVNEDFRIFLEESARHRKERDKDKKAIAQDTSNEYIDVGSLQLNTSTSAPAEQPGLRRKEEMQKLYGHHAPLIMAQEAALQLRYDRNCDTRQPVFWPSIPLKF